MRAVFWKTLFLLALSGMLYSENAQEYLERGIRDLSEEHYFRALDSFRNAIHLNPNYADAYAWLGKVYFAMGEYETALENALQALHYSQDDVDILLLTANSYRELGKFKKAETFYRKIMQRFPSNVEVYRDYAKLNLLLNKSDEALVQLKKASRIDPGNWRNALALGDYYFQLKNFNRSEKAYWRAMELNSRERRVFFKLGEYFYKRKRYSRAVPILEKGEKLFENFYSGILLLGDCYLENKNFEKAVEKYRWIEAHRLSDNVQFLALLHYKLALAYQSLSLSDSLSNYLKALSEDGENELIRYSFESFVLDHYSVGEEIRKDAALFHTKKAKLFYRNGNLDRYFFHLKRAIYLDPFLVQPRRDLVRYFERRKDFFNAYRELKFLFKVQPSSEIRDRLEHYDWQIQKGAIRLVEPRMYRFKVGILLISDESDYRRTLTALLSYLSDYRDRFKFYPISIRNSNDPLTDVLGYGRKKRFNCSLVARVQRDGVRFDLYDKVGKEFGSFSFRRNSRELLETSDRIFEWLDKELPRLAFVEAEGEDLILGMGKFQDAKKGSEVLLLDSMRSFQAAALYRVKELGDHWAKLTVLSNFESGFQPQRGNLGWLMLSNTKKDLTKIKTILPY